MKFQFFLAAAMEASFHFHFYNFSFAVKYMIDSAAE